MKATSSAVVVETDFNRGGLAVCVRPRFEFHHTLSSLILSQEEKFRESEVMRYERGRTYSVVDHSMRSCLILPGSAFQLYADAIGEFIRASQSQLFPPLGINECAWDNVQTQCLAYGEGDFFRLHRDTIPTGWIDRQMTYVYFFHRDPKPYGGGALELIGEDGQRDCIEPENGLLVIFPSHTLHRVVPVELTSSRFEDRRFVISGFISRERTWGEMAKIHTSIVTNGVMRRAKRLLKRMRPKPIDSN